MGKIAFIFPGQGAQYTGMGKDFYDSFEESRQVFDKAGELLGIDMKELCFLPNDRLDQTEYTQAAMVTTIGAILAHIKTRSICPDVCAGLSLGEYAALSACGALEIMDAILLVRKRGIFMQEAVPEGGAMAAVLGLEAEQVEMICKATAGLVTVANYNCPGQLVISGEADAVARAGEALKAEGAKRIVPLKVSGPFHSPMLIHAGEQLAKELELITVHKPEIPYVANVTGTYITQAEEIKPLLTKQVASSVRWQQSIEAMLTDGVETFVEIGPGRTLSSFVRKIKKEAVVYNIDKVSDLEKLKLE